LSDEEVLKRSKAFRSIACDVIDEDDEHNDMMMRFMLMRLMTIINIGYK
jgi:hypothetical protein